MTELPLLEGRLHYLTIGARQGRPVPAGGRTSLIPLRTPQAGEQYRFHFDATKCIGCKCCVVACNEQNGNPAAINWRRVGEIEGGHYPNTRRHYLSMGCNQCLEPSCLIGCPTEAYTKSPVTGVVEHNADACIGCQYCIWNCSYGVPQYNPERGIVGKCDLCHNRLGDGMAPACVEACPEEAIEIEIVNVAQWRTDYLSANAPGLPSADDTISTTRITLPETLSPDTGRVDTGRVVPEDPHLPLVFMLVITQLALGAFGILWLLDLTGQTGRLWMPAIASVVLAGASLAASTLHLGRPIYAWRAMRGLRRSWLSREVLFLSLFAVGGAAFAATLPHHAAGRLYAGLATVVFGALGVACSARIYQVPARPAWCSRYTPAEFFATALLLGPLFVQLIFLSNVRWVAWIGAGAAALQLAVQTLRFLWLTQSETFELRASSLLLARRLRAWFLVRLGLLMAAGILAPLPLKTAAAGAFALALWGELLGRWLFFVSVVPKSMGSAFSNMRKAS